MTLTLAFRNLFHDRIRLAVTLVGILFSIVLVAVQLGVYLGASKLIVSMVKRADSDIWIMGYGTKNFEAAKGITLRDKYAALSTAGVKSATPMVAQFNEWKRPDGGNVIVMMVGSDPGTRGVTPWNIVEGDLADLNTRDAVFIDKSYLAELGVNGVGDTAQLGGQRVRVVGLTEGIRSFTTIPFVFTTLSRGRQLLNMTTDMTSYVLLELEPGSDPVAVRNLLTEKLPDAEVMLGSDFEARTLKHWLFNTGAGIALIGGALLGLIVGTVIVAQTLYSSTKDHLNEFATLRALGSSKGYIYKVILAQAAISAVVGYAIGMAIALAIVYATQNTALPIIMTPGLAALLFALTLFMCGVSAIAAISKVTRIDPAMVFSR